MNWLPNHFNINFIDQVKVLFENIITLDIKLIVQIKTTIFRWRSIQDLENENNS